MSGQGVQEKHAVVQKRLVCEETPGHLLPCAAGQSKFGLEGLEAPELDSSASNRLGSLAACLASRALNRLPSVAPIRVDGVARPLGGGSALLFYCFAPFPSFDSFASALHTPLATA
ncbi:uncharacterized protein Tco025E_08873 [Trypanosoma conorhini]|uniref:Uncharacterized protein n=1 Tax=Trypanosoma conorhini TaxID=83891 RepID=A0A3R7RD19_9TRYP|nr:uncharacterized protein Tco025E_08873 [Trypanosoma conorhini]RNF00074.1 hypothetical protein Tco025E_08873 [Trypanosoma conorhini]